ncbi:hypothetical protein WJX77_009590 [Trebouxia sp. C0004]
MPSTLAGTFRKWKTCKPYKVSAGGMRGAQLQPICPQKCFRAQCKICPHAVGQMGHRKPHQAPKPIVPTKEFSDHHALEPSRA